MDPEQYRAEAVPGVNRGSVGRLAGQGGDRGLVGVENGGWCLRRATGPGLLWCAVGGPHDGEREATDEVMLDRQRAPGRAERLVGTEFGGGRRVCGVVGEGVNPEGAGMGGNFDGGGRGRDGRSSPRAGFRPVW